MTIKIRKHLVSESIAKRVTYNGTNSKKYIVIHETANTRKGADANAHARLQASGNSRQASWHYQVDDKEIVQSFEDTAQCWHAGNRYYNENSIGIEICVNSDGNFKKAVENAAELTRHLMRKYNIPADRVIQHNVASGKDCPRYLRRGSKGVKWTDFKRMINEGQSVEQPKKTQNTTVKSTNTGTSVPTKSIEQMAQEIIAGKHGVGHNARRKSLGISAVEYEKVRAEVNRILSGGSSDKASKAVQSPPSQSAPKKQTKSITELAQEVIDGKHGVGHTNRQKSLGISAADYEKVRAEVNRILSGKKATTAVKTKSISQMASEVLAGKHGNGHEQRRKSLGIDKATYEKVRAEVNRRLRK